MASVPCFSTYQSPVGEFVMTSDGTGLTGLYPQTHKRLPSIPDEWRKDDRFFTGVRDQLDAYFSGRLVKFDVELSVEGTEFQQRVWKALADIPFGGTMSYGALAQKIGASKAARAVGLANGKNPISIIVPCHRVVGANHSMTGYAGGVALKQWLLDHEAKIVASTRLMAAPETESGLIPRPRVARQTPPVFY